MLAAISGDEHTRFALGNLTEQTGRISLKTLYLDHVSTTLGKQLCAEWHRNKLAKLYYVDTLKRLLLILHLNTPLPLIIYVRTHVAVPDHLAIGRINHIGGYFRLSYLSPYDI